MNQNVSIYTPYITLFFKKKLSKQHILYCKKNVGLLAMFNWHMRLIDFMFAFSFIEFYYDTSYKSNRADSSVTGLTTE